MQIGLVGLGRMGANIARRLMRSGHDGRGLRPRRQRPSRTLAAEGAIAATRPRRSRRASCRRRARSGSCCRPARSPRPRSRRFREPSVRGRRHHRRRQHLLAGRHRAREKARRARRPLSRRRHVRRRVGPRARLLPDDRRRQGGGRAARSRSSRRSRRARARSRRRPAAKNAIPRVEQGYLHAGPVGAGHFVKMIHNGIEYGMMQAYAEGFDILRHAGDDGRAPEEKFDLDVADIAEVWRRGSVVTSWLLDLTASALAADPRSRRLHRPGRGFRRRPLDGGGRGRGGRARRCADGRALRALSVAAGGDLRRQDSLGHAQGFWRAS